MRGKPCPGAGGRAGRGPLGGLDWGEVTVGEAFLLNGFSLQILLLGVFGSCEEADPVSGLGPAGGRGGGGLIRLLSGVAGAEQVLV